MPKCNAKTTKEQRLAWLRANPDIWRGKDFFDETHLRVIAKAMRTAGLYSPNTGVDAIVDRIVPYLLEVSGAKDESISIRDLV